MHTLRRLLAVLVISSIAGVSIAQSSIFTAYTDLGEPFTLYIDGVAQNTPPAMHVRITSLAAGNHVFEARFANIALRTPRLDYYVVDGREISFALVKGNKLTEPATFQFLSEITLGYFPPAPQNFVTVTYRPATSAQPVPVPKPMPVPVEPQPVPVPVPAPQPVRPNPLPGYTGPIGCDYPMDPAAFEEAKANIASKSFSDTKMQIAKQVTRANCLLTSQVRDLMVLFSFESQKLEFAKFAYDFTYDRANYYKVNDAFGFESSIRELETYLQGK